MYLNYYAWNNFLAFLIQINTHIEECTLVRAHRYIYMHNKASPMSCLVGRLGCNKTLQKTIQKLYLIVGALMWIACYLQLNFHLNLFKLKCAFTTCVNCTLQFATVFSFDNRTSWLIARKHMFRIWNLNIYLFILAASKLSCIRIGKNLNVSYIYMHLSQRNWNFIAVWLLIVYFTDI